MIGAVPAIPSRIVGRQVREVNETCAVEPPTAVIVDPDGAACRYRSLKIESNIPPRGGRAAKHGLIKFITENDLGGIDVSKGWRYGPGLRTLRGPRPGEDQVQTGRL